jgi:hypothetical protein
MFATGGALQRNMAHILHNPKSGQDAQGTLYPFVASTAPGMVGGVSAMNTRGVAAG